MEQGYWLESDMGIRGPCHSKGCIGGQQDLARVTDIQPRDGPKVDTWSKVDDSSVKSLLAPLSGLRVYRGASLISKRPPPPYDHRRSLGTGLL